MKKYFIAISLLLFFTSCDEDSSNSNTNSTENEIENNISAENEIENTLDSENDANEISETIEQEIDENEIEVSKPENSETEIDNGEENTNTRIVNDGDTNIIVNEDSENSQIVINTETENSEVLENEENIETENSEVLENEENIETENSEVLENEENIETENSEVLENEENTETEPDNYDLEVVGNFITFGNAEDERVLEIENGYFSDIEYKLPISLSALNISMEFKVKNSKTVNLFFKLDEVGTARNFVFIVKEMSLSLNGELSGGNLVLLFGTRSDGTSVILSKPLNNTEIISNVNGETVISMSKVMALFPDEIGTISTFIKANSTLKVDLGVSGVESFSNSLSLYETLLDGYLGGSLTLLQDSLIENQTFGFSGNLNFVE
jgi:hypothetical protein